MLALRLERFGPPDMPEAVDMPVPVAGPGSALVHVAAGLVNLSDVKNVEGTVLPHMPGREFAGTVAEGPPEWVGAEVWSTSGGLEFTLDGSHAEAILLHADALARKPRLLSLRLGAAGVWLSSGEYEKTYCIRRRRMSWNPCPEPTLGDRASADAVETLIVPRAVDLGEMTVRRALPSSKRQMVGPFIFFDQMGPAEFLTDQGIDVRPHPHINLATLTYLFEGEILHRDSLGTEKAIQPGAVNWMRAGRGIVHSERTAAERKRRGQRLFGIQTWMALPAKEEESDPAFTHHGAEALPLIEDGGIRARLIAGRAFGTASPLATASETLYADVQLKAGASMPIDAGYDERAIYTINGTIKVGGDAFEPGQLLVLRPGDPLTVAAATDARFMLFGGAPMDGPRYIWWNFVSSRLERIEAAKEEWARGRFDTVPGDEAEFIPLPAKRDAPQRATGGVFYP